MTGMQTDICGESGEAQNSTWPRETKAAPEIPLRATGERPSSASGSTPEPVSYEQAVSLAQRLKQAGCFVVGIGRSGSGFAVFMDDGSYTEDV